jgi:peptide/nickel transport system ATP-binding protein
VRPLLEVRDLTVTFGSGGRRFDAVAGITLDLRAGETLALVGESGSGKSTVARAIAQLPRPPKGSVQFDGVDLTKLGARALRTYRGRIGMVFQDSISSLSPHRTVAQILDFPLRRLGWSDRRAREAEMATLLDLVGLHRKLIDRRPHELSGGQAQRVSIARALAGKPQLILCDEVTSGLDVSVQAQILNLLADIKEQYSLSMIFIAHDLAVVRHVADRVAVMYMGKIAEVGPTDLVLRTPAHPYTAALLASVPRPTTDSAQGAAVIGDIPSPIDPPSGCRFRTRCPLATSRCTEVVPELHPVRGVMVACHHPVGDEPKRFGGVGQGNRAPALPQIR